MPKYWGKQIFTHWSFPEVGQKEKTERKKEKERKREERKLVITMASFALRTPPRVAHASRLGQKKERRAKVGNNNGQLCIATPRKPPGTKLPSCPYVPCLVKQSQKKLRAREHCLGNHQDIWRNHIGYTSSEMRVQSICKLGRTQNMNATRDMML